MLPEITSVIWLIAGLAIGISVTGIFAVNETNKLRWVNDLLQSDLNHQVKTNKKLKQCTSSSLYRAIAKQNTVEHPDSHIAELECDRDELIAYIDQLKKAANPFINAFASHRGSLAKGGDAKLQNFLDQNEVVPRSTIGQWRQLYESVNKTPEYSLAEVNSRQATKSFIAGAESVVEQLHRMIGVPISLLENNAPPVIRQRANKHAEEILNSKDGE